MKVLAVFRENILVKKKKVVIFVSKIVGNFYNS